MGNKWTSFLLFTTSAHILMVSFMLACEHKTAKIKPFFFMAIVVEKKSQLNLGQACAEHVN